MHLRSRPATRRSRGIFHSAINSFRAKATMPSLRTRLFPSPNRRWYHWLSSLRGWWRNQTHANWTIIHRTRPVAGLADALFVPAISTVVGRRCQPCQARQLAAVADLSPAETLSNQQPCAVGSNSLETEQLPRLFALRALVDANLARTLTSPIR